MNDKLQCTNSDCVLGNGGGSIAAIQWKKEVSMKVEALERDVDKIGSSHRDIFLKIDTMDEKNGRKLDAIKETTAENKLQLVKVVAVLVTLGAVANTVILLIIKLLVR